MMNSRGYMEKIRCSMRSPCVQQVVSSAHCHLGSSYAARIYFMLQSDVVPRLAAMITQAFFRESIRNWAGSGVGPILVVGLHHPGWLRFACICVVWLSGLGGFSAYPSSLKSSRVWLVTLAS